jgi:hypothetical protein
LASSERIIGKSSRLLNCKDCRPSTHVLSAVPGFSEDWVTMDPAHCMWERIPP